MDWKGKLRLGTLLKLQEGPKLFDPRRLHHTKSWRGTHTLIIAYTVRSSEKLSESQRSQAEALGFRLPKPIAPASDDSLIQLPAESAAEPPTCQPSCPQTLPRILPPARPCDGLRVEPPLLCGGSPRVEPALIQTPSASDGLRKALPEPVFTSLFSMPAGRFVYFSVFPDLESALRSGRGWLDLFSGSRGFSKSLAALTPWWILCLDVAHDQDENLLRKELQGEILWLLRSGAFYGFSAAPAAGSFAAATGSAYRTQNCPAGRGNLGPDSFTKVQNDNDLLSFLVELVSEASENHLLYFIENPRNSRIWKQAVWQSVAERPERWDFFCDMCVFGTRWKKATRIRTNCCLAGKSLLCGCRQAHQVLRGRDRSTGSEWTKLAASYPRRFCGLLAHAIAGDAGFLGKSRPLCTVPASRSLMRPAWDQITRWERIEPTTHRTPMPEPIMLAMCALALLWRWDFWAATTLLCFYGSLRIGEVLRAQRRDFLTPADLLCEGERFFLCIREPKTRGRGARVQHSAVVFTGNWRIFFEKVWAQLRPVDKLFPGSPWTYRRRWDVLLQTLGVSPSFRLTPGCLRGGGAVAAYRRGDAVSEIQWRMRLQHLGTLAFYLQEVSALSVIPRLPKRVREEISSTAAFLPFLLLPRPAHNGRTCLARRARLFAVAGMSGGVASPLLCSKGELSSGQMHLRAQPLGKSV